MISVGMPGECRLCDAPAIATYRLVGRDERGQPDIREFDACKRHDLLIDAGQWREVIATADNKPAAMDLAQLASRGHLEVESHPKIGQVEPEGLVPPGYSRGGIDDDRQSIRRDFDWEARRNRWTDVEPGIEPDL